MKFDSLRSHLIELKGTVVSTGWALFSSLVLLFSACCIGPLAGVVSLIGISGTTSLAIANILGPFEPYLLGLAVVSLAVGFYSAYGSGGYACKEDSWCARPRYRRTVRIILWASTLITAAFIFYRYIYPRLLFTELF